MEAQKVITTTMKLHMELKEPVNRTLPFQREIRHSKPQTDSKGDFKNISA